MNTILSLTLPFFALVLLGFAATRFAILSTAAVAGINRFVYIFALPPLLFLVMSRAPIDQVMAQGVFLLAHMSAGLVLFALGWLAARLVLGRTKAEASISGLGAAYGNIGFMGLPLLVMTMGEGTAVPLGLMLLLDIAFFIPLATVIIDLTADGPERKALGSALVGSVLNNPLVIAIVSGLAFAASGWALPDALERFLTLLGQAAAPGAMFALGAVLAGRPISQGLSDAGMISILKLAVHPLVMWWAMTAVGVSEEWRLAATLGAAMPVAASVFVIAQQAGAMPVRASSAILISTGMAMVTLTLIIGWLV